MRSFVAGAITLVFLVGPAWAQDKPKQEKTPTYEELRRGLEELMEKTQKDYRRAKTEADRNQIKADYKNQVLALADKFLKVAEQKPKDNTAFESISVVLQIAEPGPTFDKAVDLLLKHHPEQVPEACRNMAESGSRAAEGFLRAVLKKSDERKALGNATVALAQVLKARSEEPGQPPADTEKLANEAEALFDKAVLQYAAVEGVAEKAKTELFELRHLGLGKVAPDISGADADDKKFKLSDYRGKVVVLDFWANW